MLALKTQTTRTEYLEFDTSFPDKHEFYDGQIFAIPSGTFKHDVIGLNITSSLRSQLRGKPCQLMNSDIRVQTPSGLDTYPDISVFCNDPELSDNEHTLHNPMVIFEVLSPTTRSYDRGDKFWHYRSIPTLQDYLLVDSESVAVEHYHRQTRVEWLMHEHHQLTNNIELKSLALTLTLQAIYGAIEFKQSR